MGLQVAKDHLYREIFTSQNQIDFELAARHSLSGIDLGQDEGLAMDVLLTATFCL